MNKASRAPTTAAGGAPAQNRQLRRQGRETLRRLLEAAITVFDERGYHAARVDDIVKVAQTSHGTFYLYFRNKEDLFLALVADVTEAMRHLAESLPPIQPSKAGYDVLRAWLDDFYGIYEHYHPVIRAWTEANSQNAELAATGATVLRRFIDQLVKRVEESDRSAVNDPSLAALAMVSMVERVSFYAVVRMVPVEREALIDNLASILHVGLFGGVRRKV
ncbi:MAG TPA: TetR/AcrR family transcriptional regulator [Acidimicrobiales bacterium]|nr:TetR/AcrR family transcriptional regulator [Acidimicrobiales bacterium]